MAYQRDFSSKQQGCVDEVLKLLQGMTREDLNTFVDNVFRYAQENDTSMAQAVNAQKNELVKIFQNRLYRLNKQNDLLFGSEGWYNKIIDKQLHINEILSKDDNLRNRGLTVDTSQEATAVRGRQTFFGSLTKNAQDALIDPVKNKMIMNYLDGNKSVENLPEIAEVGEALKNLVQWSRTELIQSGAMGLEDMQKYRNLGNSYDYAKLRQIPKFSKLVNQFRSGRVPIVKLEQARNDFINHFMNTSNLEAMFVRQETDDQMREAFGNQFDDIIRGAKITKQSASTVKVQPEIAQRSRMFVIPKDWSSWLHNEQTYGSNDNIFGAVLSEINATSRKVGMARVLGPDPNWAFNELHNAELKTYGKQPFLVSPTNLFENLNGAAGVATHPLISQMNSNFRAYIGAIKQVLLYPVTLNDTNMGLAIASQVTKTSYWQNFAKKAQMIAEIHGHELGKTELSSDTQRILSNLYHSLEYEHGANIRFMEGTNLGDITRKITSKFYQWTGIHGKDMGNRAGAAFSVAKGLADFRANKFDELTPFMQQRLKSFGIANSEWDLIRTHIEENNADGHTLVGQETIANISDEAMQKYAQNKGISLLDARADLATKIYAYLDAAAQDTVFSPTAWTRALLYQGTHPGTAVGELMRYFGQFKAFMVGYYNRLLINGFKEDPSFLKWRYIMGNFIYTLPITMMGNVIYNLAQGKPLNLDPLKWGLSDWVENLVPGIAMMTKILDPKNENSNLALSLLQSPSLGGLSDLANLGLNTVNLARPSTGKTFSTRVKHLRKQSAKVVYDFTPINSVPYLAPWWRNNLIKG